MELWREFELLKYVRGSVYISERDRLLATPAVVEQKLQPYLNHTDWLTDVTAHILSGWIKNKDVFGLILAALDHEDLEKAQRSAVGISGVYEKYRLLAKKHGKVVLPLAWEYILKFEDTVELWRLIAMTSIVAEVPHPLSIETLIWVIENSSTHDLRDAAATSLVRLANDDDKTVKRISALRSHHENIADLFSQVEEDTEEEQIIEEDIDEEEDYQELEEEDEGTGGQGLEELRDGY